MKSFKKKFLLSIGLLAIVGALFIFWQVKKTQAGALSNLAVSVASDVYTVTLTPSTTIPVDGKVYVRFGDDTDQYKVQIPADPADAGSSAAISGLVRSTPIILIAQVGTEISAGTVMTIKTDNLTLPIVDGRYMVSMWTTNSSDDVIDGSQSITEDNSAYYTIGNPFAYGRVLDPDGDPVLNAHVDIQNGTPENSFWSYGITDALGYYSIGEMREGTLSSDMGIMLIVQAPFTSEYSHLGNIEITDTYEGFTLEKNFQFILPTKTISGTIKYDNGDPVNDARINFWSTDGGGWSDARTNVNGEYSTLVKGGKWDIMPQADSSDDWSYGMPPAGVSFERDTVVESQAVNFTVQRANCTITGNIRLPDGSVPADTNDFNVNAFSMNGMGANAQLSGDGSFTLSIPVGAYNLDVHDMEQNYSVPDLAPVSLAENEVLDIGTITLIARSGTITGFVLDQNGDSVGVQLNVSAHRMRGMGWANTMTDVGDGSFTLNVFPGEWMLELQSFTGQGSEYVMDGNPESIKIVANETVSKNLTTVAATATISGSIVDTDGVAITDMFGWVFADKAGIESFKGPGLGGPVSSGRYEISVPAGTYDVGLGMMPGSEYSSGDSVNVTVADGQTADHDISVFGNDMTVSGEIRDEDGNEVKGVFMEVFATNDNGGWQSAFIDQSSGTFTLNLSSRVDPWHIGYFVDPDTGYFSEKLTDNDIIGSSGDTFIKNITIRSANATITGTVLDSGGDPMSEVFVFVDNRTEKDEERIEEEPMFMGPMFMNDNITGTDGTFSIQVPAGTYNVGASVPRDAYPTLINPDIVEVIIGANETETGVQLAFSNTDAIITGTVYLDGVAQEAFVWAWSEEGGYNETQTNTSGVYTLNVTQGDTWHVGVNNDVVGSTDYIQSNEYEIEVGSSSETQDITMETVEDGLVELVSTTFDSTSPKVSNLSDGARVSVPANALASEGNVTLNASTTSEVPRTINAKPVGTGLELTASESDGSSITSFNSNVTVVIPYDEDEVADGLIAEDDLVAAYWDETNGIWQPLDNYSIDKENDTVTFSTSHFTTFSLIGDLVDGDDDSISTSDQRPKIRKWEALRYFTESGKERLKLVVKGHHFDDDADVTIGSKSASSVKASNSGKRIVALFNMEKLRKKYDPKRKIRVINESEAERKAKKKINLNKIPLRVRFGEINGVTPEGIGNAQQILKNLGYFNHSEITGTFGLITQQAVRDFQIANNISAVGIIGPKTRAKLEEFREEGLKGK